MDPEHKNTLRVNRGKLVEVMHDVKSIVNKLFEKKTITQPMVEQILEGESISTDKKRALLDMLPRRGPNAFEEFISALLECEEWAAVECLRPGVGTKAEMAHKAGVPPTQPIHPQHTSRAAIVTSPVEDELPRFWPDEKYSPMDVRVKRVDPNDQNMLNKFERSCLTDSGYYCIQRARRGKLVIINNEDFSVAKKIKQLNLDNREGTNMDATSLDMLFKQLSFIVDTFENYSAKQIMEKLTEVSREDHTNYDCFVCFLLSHGTGGGVYGTDGEVVEIQDITDLFNSQNCRSLAGKPKMFFVQACQGTKVDPGSAGATAIPSSGPQESVPDEVSLKKAKKKQDEVLQGLRKLNIDSDSETKSDAHSEENVPTRADTFVAFATTPDYLSYRNTKRGTWFVQAITYIFQHYAYAEDLNSLMTKVNQLVSRGEILGKGYKQVSRFDSSFRKKFYFFPGLFLNESGQPQFYNQSHPSSHIL